MVTLPSTTLPFFTAPFDSAQGAGVRLLSEAGKRLLSVAEKRLLSVAEKRLLSVAEKRLLSVVEATVDCERPSIDFAPFLHRSLRLRSLRLRSGSGTLAERSLTLQQIWVI